MSVDVAVVVRYVFAGKPRVIEIRRVRRPPPTTPKRKSSLRNAFRPAGKRLARSRSVQDRKTSTQPPVVTAVPTRGWRDVDAKPRFSFDDYSRRAQTTHIEQELQLDQRPIPTSNQTPFQAPLKSPTNPSPQTQPLPTHSTWRTLGRSLSFAKRKTSDTRNPIVSIPSPLSPPPTHSLPVKPPETPRKLQKRASLMGLARKKSFMLSSRP